MRDLNPDFSIQLSQLAPCFKDPYLCLENCSIIQNQVFWCGVLCMERNAGMIIPDYWIFETKRISHQLTAEMAHVGKV
jgi:hypothetical protein